MNSDNLKMVQQLLEEKIAPSIVEVGDMTGTNDHLEILVASDVFKGKTLLQQHRLVMDVLRASLDGPVHAVKLKTLTFEQYQRGER